MLCVTLSECYCGVCNCLSATVVCVTLSECYCAVGLHDIPVLR